MRSAAARRAVPRRQAVEGSRRRRSPSGPARHPAGRPRPRMRSQPAAVRGRPPQGRPGDAAVPVSRRAGVRPRPAVLRYDEAEPIVGSTAIRGQRDVRPGTWVAGGEPIRRRRDAVDGFAAQGRPSSRRAEIGLGEATAQVSTAQHAPPRVTSSAAASRGASARRFATARPQGSHAPEGGTPRWARPARPASWIVSNGPGSLTWSMRSDRPEADPGARPPARGRAAPRVPDRDVRPSGCQPRASRPGRCRSRAGDRHAPRGHAEPGGRPSWHRQLLGEHPEVGEAGHEAHAEDAVLGAGVQAHDVVLGQPRAGGDGCQIGAVGAAVANRDRDDVLVDRGFVSSGVLEGCRDDAAHRGLVDDERVEGHEEVAAGGHRRAQARGHGSSRAERSGETRTRALTASSTRSEHHEGAASPDARPCGSGWPAQPSDGGPRCRPRDASRTTAAMAGTGVSYVRRGWPRRSFRTSPVA